MKADRKVINYSFVKPYFINNLFLIRNRTLYNFFMDDQETEIVNYVKLMESKLFGFYTTDLRRSAFDLANRNQLKHNVAADGIASLDWI